MVCLGRLFLHLKYLYFRVKNRKMFRRPEEYIPKDTDYCYSVEPRCSFKDYKRCPFHKRVSFLPEQENGYCYLINKTDTDLSCFGLLWDECKECGINNYKKGEQ